MLFLTIKLLDNIKSFPNVYTFMRLFFFFSLIITSLNIHAQYIEFDIDWTDGIEYEIEKNKVNVPQIENFEINYSFINPILLLNNGKILS